MTRIWLTLATAGILTASSAWADDVRVPRVEIGGNITAVVPLAFEDSVGVLAGGGPRVTLNLSQRIAVELMAEVIGPVDYSGTMALYEAQAKLPLRKSRGGERTLSFTAGVAGTTWYHRVAETRTSRPDGSTVVHPGFRELRAGAPTSVTVGVSGDRVINRHVSGSWAVRGLFGSIGGAVLASASVSFGVGSYR